VRAKSLSRISAHPTFSAIRQSYMMLEKSNDKVYSLQLSKYRQEQKEIREAFKKIDASSKDVRNLQVSILGVDEIQQGILVMNK